jgi:hypothetical protein
MEGRDATARRRLAAMTEFVCARCGRDLRLVAHKISEDGERYCLSCEPIDERGGGLDDLETSLATPPTVT